MKNTLTFVLGLFLASTLVETAPLAFAAITQKFVETPTITLYGSISSSATSMRVVPYPKDLSGNKLTMSDLGSTPTITIDPKVKSAEEIVSFTGITDNGDNTATLTGLTRGLLSKYPYTTGGTAYPHAASAIVVFSNNPQLYARLWSPENDATSTGTLAFTSTALPHLDTEPLSWSLANPESFVTYAKLSATSIAGAVNGSTIQNGIVQLATALQAASSTATGSTAANLVLWASYATSSNDVPGLHVVVTQNSGKINWNQIDLGNASTFTGVVTFNTGGFIDNASSTITATSTLLAFTSYGISTSTIAGNLTIAGNASTTNLTVSKICTNCSENGRAVVTNTGAGPSTTGATASVTATCSGSQLVQTGGGTIGTPGSASLSQSYPSASNAWTIQVTSSANTTSGTMTVYAVCVNP